ncbi:MAG TPA: hypothetical protein EYP06_06270 [Desulfobacterales bacterium]|nr:hypothetical protein [Desulfobacterales bacterium]
MPEIPIFYRLRSSYVDSLSGGMLRAVCVLLDTVTEAKVEVFVRPPDLEVVDVKASVLRGKQDKGALEPELLGKLIGIRIGPGIKKIIRGTVGKSTPNRMLGFMIEEACNAVILSFTKDVLKKVPKGKAATVEFYSQMVKENIRLYNRCAAFAPGSTLVEGLKPPI